MVVLSVAKHISSNNINWINLSQSQRLRKLKRMNWQKMIQVSHMEESQGKMNLKSKRTRLYKESWSQKYS